MSNEAIKINPEDASRATHNASPNKEDSSLVTRHSSLLLELGTEEIPARFLPPAITMMKADAEAIFNEYLVGFSEMKTYGTPRRLCLLVKGIPPKQQERIREVYGPPKKAAFDDKGNPTKAAIGFAQSQGIEVSELITKKKGAAELQSPGKDKGEYVVAVIRQEGLAVKDLLPEVLRKIILSLNFPKTMRWGNGSLRFVRPIHWILALLDGETVPFEIDGIKSGSVTKGHRFLSPGTFVIREILSYIHLLENNYVIVDQAERRRIIESGIETLSSSVGGRAVKDEDLLNTVTCLVEYPVPVLCEFPSEYLTLPKELLTTVMKDHQKYFAVEDGEGRLKNYFVVISNTKAENAETVKTGAERVIKARFEDARFYYGEDREKPLHARIEDLKRVTFHDRLGTLYDKTERIVKLASFLAEKLLPDKKQQVERAAGLSKTDLITGVVGEFPELQGLIGRYYALNDGEDGEVAEAIMQQYLPSYSGDRLPTIDIGSLLSLADKTDNIVSFFAIGLTPTGSEDPYALRRQALGVIAILLEKGYELTLREMIGKAAEKYADTKPSLSEEVLLFFAQRIEPLLSSQGYENDMIQSVIHLVDNLPLREVKERIGAARRFSADSGYNAFLLAMKRINNIVPKMELPSVKEDLLLEEQEKDLLDEIRKIGPVVRESLAGRKYYEAVNSLSELTVPVNNFFDKVLVMDKREEVKLNRLALLKEIWTMAATIADFSKLKER